MIKMIVATDNNWGIGYNNFIPWSISEDMKFFRNMTIGKGNNAIVMGRKTHESIGLILSKRENIVLTRNLKYTSPLLKSSTLRKDVVIKQSAVDVIAFCNEKQYDVLWVIGGEDIYREFMDYTNEIYITKIENSFQCDRFFPELPERFSLVLEEKVDLKNQKDGADVVVSFQLFSSV